VDECSIWTYLNPNFCWQLVTKVDEYSLKTPKNVEKVHLFAGIAINGKTDLHIFE